MNEPVHVSLLADYYPAGRHGRVFSIHKAANAIGAGCTPLCGLLADAMGWRAAFMLIAVPTFLAWMALLRLREPDRGASIDPVAAAARAADGVQRRSFRDGARALRAVPSLRRICVASFAIGAAILPIALFVSFYFEKDHGVDSGTARGAIIAIVAVGSLVGLHLGSNHATKALMAGDLPRLATLAGWALGLTGVGFLALALAPWTALAVAITLVLGLGGAINSFALPLLAAVTPPALRSQAGGWFGFSAGMGALLVAPPAAALGEGLGYRWAISLLSLVLVGAGIAMARVAPHVRADADRAYASLFAPTSTPTPTSPS
jgi:branched-chain amino acid transport system ATP-binding protein